MNNKKSLLILTFIFLIISVGISYAYFVFMGSAGDSEIIAGDIYMHFNNSDAFNLNLNSLLSDEDARDMTENVISFTIDGKNTSDKTIYYEVKIKHGEDDEYRTRVFDSTVRFDLVENTDGNENMIISASSYDDFNGKVLYIDTIPGNTNSYYKSFYLRVWISNDSIISDTDPNADFCASSGCENDLPLATNSYANVIVEVNGDFEEKVEKNLYNALKKNAVMDNIRSDFVLSDSGIDFNYFSSETNGKGLYTLSSTATDSFPVMYYRGNVSNNNLLFAGLCWKIVRTTENGGVKLLYSGLPGNIYETVPVPVGDYTLMQENPNFVYDAETNSWICSDPDGTGIEFGLEFVDGFEKNYNINVTMALNTTAMGIVFYDEDEEKNAYFSKDVPFDVNFVHHNDLHANPDAFMMQTLGNGVPNTFIVKISENVRMLDTKSCNNSNNDTSLLPLNESVKFYQMSNSYDYMYSNSYMYYDSDLMTNTNNYSLNGKVMKLNNNLYDNNYKGKIMQLSTYTKNKFIHYTDNGTYYYGTAVTKNNGLYKLSGTIDNNISIEKRYTLRLPDSTAEQDGFYIILSSSSGVKHAVYQEDYNSLDDYLNNLFGGSNVESLPKTIIDEFFSEGSALNYAPIRNYIDDVVWCNDRSYSYYEDNGYFSLLFGTHKRLSLDANDIDLSCPLVRDSYTVSDDNGNGNLDYPIGLLTTDEIVLSGYGNNSNAPYIVENYFNNAFPLVMTPAYSGENGLFLYPGNFSTDYDYSTYLRPSIALKNGVIFDSGDGTFNNPYVVAGDIELPTNTN